MTTRHISDQLPFLSLDPTRTYPRAGVDYIMAQVVDEMHIWPGGTPPRRIVDKRNTFQACDATGCRMTARDAHMSIRKGLVVVILSG
jgi:hypothetical protein